MSKFVSSGWKKLFPGSNTPPIGQMETGSTTCQHSMDTNTKWDLCQALLQKWFRYIHVQPAGRAQLGNEFQAGNCTETKMRWWSEHSEWNSVGKSELTFHSSWLAAQEDKAELTLPVRSTTAAPCFKSRLSSDSACSFDLELGKGNLHRDRENNQL